MNVSRHVEERYKLMFIEKRKRSLPGETVSSSFLCADREYNRLSVPSLI